MKSNSSYKYMFSDALLLASISLVCKKEPADLQSIYSAGDYLNHAIFSFDELESGLFRLVSGGWIQESSGKRFFTTNKFTELMLKISNINGVIKLAKILGTSPWNVSYDECKRINRLKYPGITKELMTKALDGYLKM